MELTETELNSFERINQLYNTEYTNQLLKHQHIFYELQEAWGPEWDGQCGGYLFNGRSYTYDEDSYPKQELLYKKAKQANNICEVGSYVGHSLFIMLMANPECKIVSIDISNKFTGPAVEVLNRHFGDRVRFIHADSVTGLKQLQEEGAEFDLFHLDGDHDENLIIQEYGKCSAMSSCYPTVKIVFDDEVCMRGFQNYLQTHRANLTLIIPNCTWSNVYMEFDEPEIRRVH